MGLPSRGPLLFVLRSFVYPLGRVHVMCLLFMIEVRQRFSYIRGCVQNQLSGAIIRQDVVLTM